jgi:hypothetical protein
LDYSFPSFTKLRFLWLKAAFALSRPLVIIAHKSGSNSSARTKRKRPRDLHLWAESWINAGKLNSGNQNQWPFLVKQPYAPRLKGYLRTPIRLLCHSLHANNFASAKLNRDRPGALACLDEIRKSDKQLFGNLQLRTAWGGRSILSLIFSLLGLGHLACPKGNMVARWITVLGQLRRAVCEVDSIRHKIPS